jgi:hypothetical protein
LGRVGSCNNNTSVGAKKTASCQLEKLEISGGKRKREAVNIKLVILKTEKLAASLISYQDIHFYLGTTFKSLNCQQLLNKDAKEH